MSNTEKTWKNGDLITADDMNRLEAKTSRTLLWVNASTQSQFPQQIIRIDNILDFSGIEIVCKQSPTGVMQLANTGFIPVNPELRIVLSVANHACNRTIYQRMATMLNYGFEFETAYKLFSDGTIEEDSEYCVPFRIYGIKGVKE